VSEIDWTRVERIWEARLRERGLAPTLLGDGVVATGLAGLQIRRLCAQKADVQIENPTHRGTLASVETGIRLELPAHGDYEIRDLVTQRADTADAALDACAHAFMDVTFPPLEALITGRRPEGPGTGRVTLHSYTPAIGHAIAWEVVLGPLQILEDATGALRECLRAKPPVTLVLDTLTGYLAEQRLHWGRLYGATSPEAGPKFGCAIDGMKSEPAEAELARKLGATPAGSWQFRQFFAARATGPADPSITAELKRLHGEPGRDERGFWSRLLGR
jgi:hypothetical protein